MTGRRRPRPFTPIGDARPTLTAAQVADVFDPRRLVQARHLTGMSRGDLAIAIGERPWKVLHWESGISKPVAYQVERIADATRQLVAFFAAGRPMAQIDSSELFMCEVDR